MRGVLICFVFLLTDATWAQAPLGPTYPVIEPDMLEMVKRHAQEKSHLTHAQMAKNEKRLRLWRESPRGQQLPETEVEVKHRFTVNLPAEVIPQDYYRAWLLVDGFRAAHMALARRFIDENPVSHRVVLVNGNLKRAEEQLQTRVWFDQGATLTQRLQVQTVPTRITFNRDAVTLESLIASKSTKRTSP